MFVFLEEQFLEKSKNAEITEALKNIKEGDIVEML
jgi:hypothetical protein